MLSREALELLEFSLGPKAKRGRGDPNANRVGKQFGKAVFGAAALPVYSVFGHGSHQQRSGNAVAAINRTVKKTPEVMVKMTGRQNGQAHVAENFSYIARLGWGEDKELELLTSEGKTITNRKEMSGLAREWHLHETADRVRRQGSTSLSFVLSMPPGTDPEKMKSAAAEFAKTEMAGRRWVMGLHTDQAHPHVHLTVARRDIDGKRFHPGKEDLFRYRQTFAEKLRDVGIEANATPRKARGISQKAEKSPIVQIRKRGDTPRADKRTKNDIIAAFMAGKTQAFYDRCLKDQRDDVAQVYKKASMELVTDPDQQNKELAMALGHFFNKMPPAITRQSALVIKMIEAATKAQTRTTEAAQKRANDIKLPDGPNAPTRGKERDR